MRMNNKDHFSPSPLLFLFGLLEKQCPFIHFRAGFSHLSGIGICWGGLLNMSPGRLSSSCRIYISDEFPGDADAAGSGGGGGVGCGPGPGINLAHV